MLYCRECNSSDESPRTFTVVDSLLSSEITDGGCRPPETIPPDQCAWCGRSRPHHSAISDGEAQEHRNMQRTWCVWRLHALQYTQLCGRGKNHYPERRYINCTDLLLDRLIHSSAFSPRNVIHSFTFLTSFVTSFLPFPLSLTLGSPLVFLRYYFSAAISPLQFLSCYFSVINSLTFRRVTVV